MMNFEQSLYVIVHIRAGIPPKQLGLVYVWVIDVLLCLT